jgi:GTP-sensing pleiotropic transcriptional regulator CodY
MRDGSKTDEQISKESVSVIGTIRNVIDPDSQARKKQNYEQMLQHRKKLEDEYGQKILDAREAQERLEILEGVAAEEIHY